MFWVKKEERKICPNLIKQFIWYLLLERKENSL